MDIIDIGYRLDSTSLVASLQRFRDVDTQAIKLEATLSRLSNRQSRVTINTNFKSVQDEVRQLDNQLKQLKNITITANVKGITDQFKNLSVDLKINPIIDLNKLKSEVDVVVRMIIQGHTQGQGQSQQSPQRSVNNTAVALPSTIPRNISSDLDRLLSLPTSSNRLSTMRNDLLKQQLGDLGDEFSKVVNDAKNAFIRASMKSRDIDQSFNKTVEKYTPSATAVANRTPDAITAGVYKSEEIQKVLRAAIAKQTNISDLTKNIQDAQKQAMILDSALGGIGQTLRQLAGVSVIAGIGAGLAELVSSADKMDALQQRIKLVSTASVDLEKTQQSLVDIANANGSSLDSVGKLYTRLVPALDSYNVTMKGTQDNTGAAIKLTAGLSAALRLNNASTQESRSAILQFSQALGSGRLNGDEFRSLAEAAPTFMKALADGMGTSLGSLKKMSSEGKLTTEAVVTALSGQIDGLIAKSSTIPLTLSGTFEVMSNKFMLLADAINESTGFLETIKGVISGVGNGFEGLANSIKVIDEVSNPILVALKNSVEFLLIAVGSSALAFATATLGVTGFSGAMGVATLATRTLTTAMMANPYLAVATAILGVGAAVYSMTDFFKSSQPEIDKSTASLASYKKQLDLLPKTSDLQAKLNAKPGSSSLTGISITHGLYSEDDKRQLQDLDSRLDAIHKQRSQASDPDVLDNLTQEIAVINELKARLQEQFDIKSRINLLDSGQAYNDRLAKLRQEITSHQQINALLSQGYSLQRAKDQLDIQRAFTENNKAPVAPTISMDADANALAKYQVQMDEYIAKYAAFDAKRKQMIQESVDLPKQAEELQSQQQKILDSRKESKKPSQAQKDSKSFAKEISELQELIDLAKTHGDVERARKAILGANSSEIERHIQLTKELKDIERQSDLKSQIGEQQSINNALNVGKLSEQAILEYKLSQGEISKQTFDLESKLLSLKTQQSSSFSGMLSNIQRQIDLSSIGLSTEQSKTVELMTQYNILQGMSKDDAFRKSLDDLAIIEQKSSALQRQQDIVGKTNDILKTISERDSNPLAGMDLSALGNYQDPFKGMVESITRLTTATEDYNRALEQAKLQGQDVSKVQKYFAQQELSNIAAMLGATKGFFNEKSKGYKAIQAAERTYKAFELASTLYNSSVKIGSMIEEGLQFTKLIGMKVAGLIFGTSVDTASTGVEVANAGARATAKGMESAVNSGKDLPFPANLAAMAATVAAIAALGVSLSGGGGGSGGGSVPSKASVRGNGFGTALGDNTTSSDSITKSLDGLSSISVDHLRISSNMLSRLTEIRDNLGGFSASIFQTNVELGSKLRRVEISGGNIEAVGGGGQGSIKYTELFSEYFSKTVADLQTVFRESASSIGLSIADSFNLLPDIAIGGLRKLKGEELTDRLNSVFSLIADTFVGQGLKTETIFTASRNIRDQLGNIIEKGSQLTQEQLSGLSEKAREKLVMSVKTPLDGFQQAGEGLFETLTRVSSGIEEANYYLGLINRTSIQFGEIQNKNGDVATNIFKQSIGLSGVAQGIKDIVSTFQGSISDIADLYNNLVSVADGLRAIGKSSEIIGFDLINSAGGVDALSGYLDSFFEDILSPTERFAELQKRVSKQFSDIGLSLPTSVAGLRDVINSINDPKLLGKVLSIVPNFVDLQKAFEDAAASVGRSMSDLEDNLRQSYDAEKNRLQKLIDSYTNLESSLKGYSETLSTTAAMLSPSELLRTTREKFSSTLELSRTGNETALKDLSTVSKDYLDAASKYFGSSSGYFDILATVKSGVESSSTVAGNLKTTYQSQLDAITDQVGAMIDLTDGILSLEEAIRQFNEGVTTVSSPVNQGVIIPQSSQTVTNSSPVSVDNSSEIVLKLTEISAKLDSIILVDQSGYTQSIEVLKSLRDEVMTLNDTTRLGNIAGV